MEPVLLNVNRAQAVVWVSDEMRLTLGEDGVRRWIESSTLDEVRRMVGPIEDGDPEIRLVSLDQIKPADAAFDELARREGLRPTGTTPYVAVWEVTT